MAANITRRLINHDLVALKLNISPDRLYHVKRKLYAAGFPQPVLGVDRGETMQWDEKAIDLWLDSKMDPALLTFASKMSAITPELSVVQARLSERAKLAVQR